MCFYVQPLKVGSCTNDDNSVPNILLSFSASIQMVLFSESLLLGKLPDFDENCHFFLSMPKQCTGIPVQKITMPHAHKCVISDVIRHNLIFSVVTSSPGGSCMSHQVETIQERNEA